MNRAAVALGLAILLPAIAARGAEPPVPPVPVEDRLPRFTLGAVLNLATAEEHPEIGIGARATLRPMNRAAIAAAFGVSTWAPKPTDAVGYSTYRTYAELAPRFVFYSHRSRRPPDHAVEAYVALPLGLDFPHVSPPPRRALVETTAAARSWYAGLGVGATGQLGHGCISVELHYEQHSIGFHSTVAPIDGSHAPVTTEFRDRVHTLVLTIGGELAFYREGAYGELK